MANLKNFKVSNGIEVNGIITATSINATLTGAALDSPTFTGTVTVPSLNVEGGINAPNFGPVTSDEIQQLDGVTSNIQQQLDAKAKASDLTNHSDGTTNVHGIADTSKLATTTYVDNAIANAGGGGGNVDLTPYAKKYNPEFTVTDDFAVLTTDTHLFIAPTNPDFIGSIKFLNVDSLYNSDKLKSLPEGTVITFPLNYSQNGMVMPWAGVSINVKSVPGIGVYAETGTNYGYFFEYTGNDPVNFQQGYWGSPGQNEYITIRYPNFISKTEVGSLNGIQGNIQQQIDNINTNLSDKALTSYVDAGLSSKASISYVDSAIANSSGGAISNQTIKNTTFVGGDAVYLPIDPLSITQSSPNNPILYTYQSGLVPGYSASVGYDKEIAKNIKQYVLSQGGQIGEPSSNYVDISLENVKSSDGSDINGPINVRIYVYDRSNLANPETYDIVIRLTSQFFNAVYTDAVIKFGNTTIVSPKELGYLDGLTGNIQEQINVSSILENKTLINPAINISSPSSTPTTITVGTSAFSGGGDTMFVTLGNPVVDVLFDHMPNIGSSAKYEISNVGVQSYEDMNQTIITITRKGISLFEISPALPIPPSLTSWDQVVGGMKFTLLSTEVTISPREISYLNGLTSNVKTEINSLYNSISNKIDMTSPQFQINKTVNVFTGQQVYDNLASNIELSSPYNILNFGTVNELSYQLTEIEVQGSTANGSPNGVHQLVYLGNDRYQLPNAFPAQEIKYAIGSAFLPSTYTVTLRSNNLVQKEDISKLSNIRENVQYQLDKLSSSGNWQSYTPEVFLYNDTPNLGNGSASGRYTRIGNTVHYEILVMAFGAGKYLGTGNNPLSISLPTSASQEPSTTGSCYGKVNNRAIICGNYGTNINNPSQGTVDPQLLLSDFTLNTVLNGDPYDLRSAQSFILNINGTYEVGV